VFEIFSIKRSEEAHNIICTHLRPNIDSVYTLAIAIHRFPPLAAAEEENIAAFFCHDEEGCSSLRHHVLRLQLPGPVDDHFVPP
jgi:hypothetical protein